MLNRVLGNFAKVLRGRGIAAVLSVGATGLMANALAPAEFGLVILLHTYVMVVKGLLNFRTFEAIVRFGVPLHDAGDQAGLHSLLRATVFIDVLASVAATVIGISAVPLAAVWLHWNSELAGWAVIYAALLITTATNTSSGILRLYDRFDALGVQYTIGPAVRFVLVGMAWLADAGMAQFVLAWGGAFLAGNVYMLARGLREWRAHSNLPLWRGLNWRDLRDRDGRFWRFIGVVYWQTGVDLLPKHVSTLLAGNLLGPAAAGLFRLAREISTVLTQPAVLLREVLFPDLTRAWHAGDHAFRQLPLRATAIAGGAGLVFVMVAQLAGEPILRWIGEDYVAAHALMVLLLIGAAFDLAGAPLRAAVYAMGRASALLRIHVIGLSSYVVLFYILTQLSGLNGPGYAAFLASILTFALTMRVMARSHFAG